MSADHTATNVLSRLAPLLLLLLLVPTVDAQVPSSAPPVEISIEPDSTLPNGLLTPETGLATVKVLLSVGCMTPPPLAQTEIRFAVEARPDYATVILNPPVQSIAIAP